MSNIDYCLNRLLELEDEFEQGQIDYYEYIDLKEQWQETLKTLEATEEDRWW